MMQTRSQTLKGIQRLVVSDNPNANPIVSFPDVYTDNFVVVNAGTTSGDRKSPYPQEFYRTVVFGLDGQWTAFLPSGGSYNRYLGSINGWFPDNAGQETRLISSHVYNEAQSKVFDRIRGNVDLALAIAESSQTKRMIKSIGEYSKYLLRFRRGEIKGLWNDHKNDPTGLKSAGSKWLTYNFGIKPLAQDLYGSIEELGRLFPTLMVVNERKSEKTSFASTYTQSNTSATTTAKFEREERAHFRILYRPPTSTLNLLSNFGSVNPVSFAWELMPWSFAIDYVFDLGGFLRNVESSMLTRSAFKSGFVTETKYVQNISEYFGPASGLHKGDFYKGRRVFKWKRRTVLATNPLPRAPQFNVVLGSTRLLNAAALLSQFLGHKR